jgi:hypothetical protein
MLSKRPMLCQIVSLDERSSYYVFFFTFKVHEKNVSKLGLIFSFRLILVFGIFFFFIIDRFITISNVFVGVFGQK